MGRCEVSSVPASTHPLLTSICRGTCRTTGFVWGVGVMTERSHTHTQPPPPEMENNRYFCYEVKRFLLVGPFKKKPCFYSGQHSGVKRFYAFTPTWTFRKSSQWNNKCQSCEKIEMYTSSLLTETVGCIKLLWTPVMRKLRLVLPLGVEKHPCHCA